MSEAGHIDYGEENVYDYPEESRTYLEIVSDNGENDKYLPAPMDKVASSHDSLPGAVFQKHFNGDKNHTTASNHTTLSALAQGSPSPRNTNVYSLLSSETNVKSKTKPEGESIVKSPQKGALPPIPQDGGQSTVKPIPSRITLMRNISKAISEEEKDRQRQRIVAKRWKILAGLLTGLLFIGILLGAIMYFTVIQSRNRETPARPPPRKGQPHAIPSRPPRTTPETVISTTPETPSRKTTNRGGKRPRPPKPPRTTPKTDTSTTPETPSGKTVNPGPERPRPPKPPRRNRHPRTTSDTAMSTTPETASRMTTIPSSERPRRPKPPRPTRHRKSPPGVE